MNIYLPESLSRSSSRDLSEIVGKRKGETLSKGVGARKERMGNF